MTAEFSRKMSDVCAAAVHVGRRSLSFHSILPPAWGLPAAPSQRGGHEDSLVGSSSDCRPRYCQLSPQGWVKNAAGAPIPWLFHSGFHYFYADTNEVVAISNQTEVSRALLQDTHYCSAWKLTYCQNGKVEQSWTKPVAAAGSPCLLLAAVLSICPASPRMSCFALVVQPEPAVTLWGRLWQGEAVFISLWLLWEITHCSSSKAVSL